MTSFFLAQRNPQSIRSSTANQQALGHHSAVVESRADITRLAVRSRASSFPQPQLCHLPPQVCHYCTLAFGRRVAGEHRTNSTSRQHQPICRSIMSVTRSCRLLKLSPAPHKKKKHPPSCHLELYRSTKKGLYIANTIQHVVPPQKG